jgi:hypothetical protein
VGQGTYLYLTFCTVDALAVELEDTAMAGTVIVVSDLNKIPISSFS